MITFIEDQRVVYGVESICRVLPIAPFIARQAIAEQSAERGHITTGWHVTLILQKPLGVLSETLNCVPRSNGFGMTIIKSTAFEKLGIS